MRLRAGQSLACGFRFRFRSALLRTGCKSAVGLSRSEFNKTLLRRFKSKCGAADLHGCIPWLGHRTVKGYGCLTYSKDHRKTTAHRIAWVLEQGDIAPEVLVLHKCDNPSCVNVEHMFLGSAQENMDDMVRKQRHSWLERTPWQKLNTHDVKRIRDLRQAGQTQQAVADQLGISRTLISLIEHGKVKHAQSAISL